MKHSRLAIVGVFAALLAGAAWAGIPIAPGFGLQPFGSQRHHRPHQAYRSA